MRFYKRFFASCMVIFFLLIDTSVMPFAGVNVMYMPKLSLLAALVIAMLMGRTQGMIYSTLGGVLMDISLTIPTGLVSVLYTISALVASFIAQRMRMRLLISVIAPIAAMAVFEFVLMAYYYLSAQTVSLAQFFAILARIGIGTVIVQPLYLLFNAVLKPPRSRYAARN